MAQTACPYRLVCPYRWSRGIDRPVGKALTLVVIRPGAKLDLRFPVRAISAVGIKEMPFADLLSRRTIVSVYMKNDTPTCDRQTASLAAAAAEFDRAGFNVVAVSRNTAGSNARYAAAKHISYTLVSDPEDHFARATDSLIEKSMYGRKYIGPSRSAFILDPDGTVLAIVEKVDAAAHAEQLRRAIKSV